MLSSGARCWCTLALFICLSACDKDSGLSAYYRMDAMVSGVHYTALQEADGIINPDDEYIVVLGDVQEYTAEVATMAPLQRSLLWTLSQRSAYNNIACVLEVGDVTNWNGVVQWERYEEAIRNVVKSGLPVFSSTGNHDYDVGEGAKIRDRKSTRINNYLSYCFPDSVVKARFEEGRIENLIVRLPLKSVDIDMIMLEFAPRKEVVDWACRWVAAHPEQKFILMTHEMLWNDGTLIGPGTMCYAERHFAGTASTWTSPKELVERLLKPNPNVKAALSGHNGFAAVNYSQTNVAGAPIPLIQFNLQYQENAGDSMVLLLRFDSAAETADCTVYHTDGRRPVDTPISGYSFSIGD